MTAAVVDLAAVARARAELAVLVAAHPELTSPAARARLGDALPDLMEPTMSKSLDPNHTPGTGASRTLAVRMDPYLWAIVDAEMKRLSGLVPGAVFSPSDAVRNLIRRASTMPLSMPPETTVENNGIVYAIGGGARTRGAMGAGPRGASTRGAAGASGAATDDQMPEEPPLVRAPSVPPRRATMPPAPNPSRYGSRYGSPLPALPTPRVPTDIVVPEAVELDDDHEPVEARHTEPHAAPALDATAVRARLIELRAADPKAWSYSKIAERIGMSEGPPEKVVTGRPVSPDTLKRIAAILPPKHTGKTST